MYIESTISHYVQCLAHDTDITTPSNSDNNV